MTSSLGNVSGLPAGADAPARSTGARRDDSLDATLSSTTPDVPRQPKLLSPLGSIGWGLGIGAGLGALLLRPSGAGWALGALGTGAWKGAMVGAGMGAALLGLDRITDGQVKKQLDYVSLDRRAQILFVLKNPTNPWIAGTGIGVARDAQAMQDSLYGRWDPKDGPQDAFRHAFAAGLFSLRAIRDHGETPENAHRLAIGAGDAHEADGQDNNDDYSRAMDVANNLAGTQVVGDGRALPGEDADADGFLTERGLRDRVLGALHDGRLHVIERGGDGPTTRASAPTDMPGVAAPIPGR